MTNMYDLERFIEAQSSPYAGYTTALNEIKHGRKTSHWIWYIFPQIHGLGFSHNAKYYAISNLHEAEAYLKNDILGARLREVSIALLLHKDKSAIEILGRIDALKVCSCMTLFDFVSPNDVFRQVLDVFYEGKEDTNTLLIIQSSNNEQQ